MAKLKLTELVLRDAHQSLLATRMRLDDMLPIASKLDDAGYWSIESWGGATFDSCIRYLGEDPWERIRALKKAMPNTKQQMLLRGQNLLGYRHYADDVVEKFVERAHKNGVDVFRIFDAMNDVRNLETAIKAAVKVGAHAQGTISYTVSPVHTLDMWLTLAKQLEDMGCHSICIKDMAGLLKPYDAEKLIKALKETVSIPIAMQCHATTGLSTATYQKAIDAGIDMLDTAISSMSMTYGHSATETIVSIVEGTERDTELDLNHLEEIAAYFRDVRKKYAAFEGSLKGVDGRILLAQVPGGMLTNMENQLKEQGAADKLNEVLLEIPRVREDLGFLPLVTPTSQIVGTQAVLNVLTGERYKTITKETAGVLKGEYGLTPAPMNKELQERVLDGAEVITCRPADNIAPELATLEAELLKEAQEQGLTLADDQIDDVLTYALFPQVGLKFIKNRNNPDAFEPVPSVEDKSSKAPSKSVSNNNKVKAEQYSVKVDGKVYDVVVAQGGELKEVTLKDSEHIPQSASVASGETLNAPLAGNIFKIKVKAGQVVNEGDVVIIMEAMKMETEIRATHTGTIAEVLVSEGDAVTTGDAMIALA
ncbi:MULTISPECIES: sodium-extruding oxaloacetate decarboxylase subunit alpha [Pseudoalteromonas]|jgi:oxaloacetate decarboxylase alpha subunit|uniref:sodium-extruding oxaloacetate decarboxylase subunit alpha n=1 Tax=Pseudoalteromonas TaxID=53246 RepID=UPI0011F10D9E|nr:MULTISPECIES: sodium-extruding oxaloacetate decarboxylase subunit alpha [Pseudoalteromonas]KAA1158407.1 oxaloacetate decarboxylase subunit alpha [Pseudoalteromonas distincta]MBB1280948.1 sodium-extruding oxaloacetate decarboxylase subunit alpha [Pseudoalteromonas sp. SR41-1]MBB1345248.1 sodium-extruding oxaloacetate decarboxylase subunit alpha [Pseudoalteromonas sp. SG45-2]MBB1451298.1 sodium-extruding oxaloacetate decarboxylase subunit alpha [Pseudoalteromonas sp. SG43-1]MBB1453606.1 sodiu|tara:strand:+ start:24294 stop:26075 length:1782 start_codon:yes stop_codon:yes gene_type:complete